MKTIYKGVVLCLMALFPLVCLACLPGALAEAAGEPIDNHGIYSLGSEAASKAVYTMEITLFGTMCVGDTQRVNIYIYADGDVGVDDIQLTSSNSGAISISKKLGSYWLTANRAGVSEIRASYQGHTDAATVTVSGTQPTAAHLSKPLLTMKKGASFQMHLITSAEQVYNSISWSSSKKSVASISGSGQIKAKGNGTTTITARTDTGLTVSGILNVKSYAETPEEYFVYDILNGSAVVSMYTGPDSLSTVVVPASLGGYVVKRIGYGAFQWRQTIKKVVLPSGLTNIDDYAFYFCNRLESINFPSGLVSLGNHSFGLCEKLPSVAIPKKVTKIPRFCFYGCKSLKSLQIKGQITAIEAYAFFDCAFTKVTISRNVTTIDNTAFVGCSKLQAYAVDKANLNFSSKEGVLFNKHRGTLLNYPAGKKTAQYKVPPSVTKIDYSAFAGSKYLQSVSMGNHVKTIGAFAFLECSKLKKVVLSSSVSYIDAGTFEHCKNLKSIEFPEGVEQIGRFVLGGCSDDMNVYLPRSLTLVEPAYYDDDPPAFPVGATLHVYSGSYAQAYADDNGYRYQLR